MQKVGEKKPRFEPGDIIPESVDLSELFNFVEPDSWQQYNKILKPTAMIDITSGNEKYSGEFGKYPPDEGYFQEYIPYEFNKATFREELDRLHKSDYIRIGETKAVNIDYSVLFPSTGIFINVNLLVEFTHLGQLLPTRFDVAYF